MITTTILYSYLTLLLQANAEWVEISQQYYVKPTKQTLHNDETTAKVVEATEKTHLPWSSSESVDSETTTKIYNTSLNRHWSKGSVLRVPANVARVEHVKKPDDNSSQRKSTKPVKIRGEYNNTVQNKDISADVEDENTSTKKKAANSHERNIIRDRKKGNSNSMSKNLLTSASYNETRNVPQSINNKRDNLNRRKEEIGEKYPDEKILEIYEITIPKNYGSTKAPVRINPFVNKSSAKRTNSFSTEYSNKMNNSATEQPLSTISKSKIRDVDNGPKNTESSHENPTPFLAKPFENKRRIYIQDLRKPSEDFSFNEEDSISGESSINSKKIHDVPQSTELQHSNISKNDGIDSNFNKPNTIINKGKRPNRIYINDLRTPEDNSELMTRRSSTVLLTKKKSTPEVYTQNEHKNTSKIYQSNKIIKKEKSPLTHKTDEPFITTKSAAISKLYEKRAHIVRIDKLTTRKTPVNLDFVEYPNDSELKHNTEDNQIRRIDITTLTVPHEPEFVTKQEYFEENYPKYLYKDVVETVKTPTSSYESYEISTQSSEEDPNDDDKAKWPNIDKRKNHVQLNPTTEETFKHNNFETSKTNMKMNAKKIITKEKVPNPLENVIKLMKLVSDTITKNSHNNIKSKMRYLEDLRDTLLLNIEDHVEATWPDDHSSPDQRARERREAQAQSRGHVDFPSSEGALMSISFLTFAVFLIKLVLQVINTFKRTPAVFAVSRAAATVAERT